MQANQTRRLGGHAVHGDELLLLADGVEEAQRMRAEAHQGERAKRQQAEHGGGEHPSPFAPALRCEHEEGQRKPGRDLDADAHDERACGRAKARAGTRGERQRGGEHHCDQRVVVRAADGEHE